MNKHEKQKLVLIHECLSGVLGDSDPPLDDMTDSEIMDEEPLFWAAKEIAGLIGDISWDKLR